jgi:quinol-cytochrome oxidoreductase complex cytochrome b subunit
VFGIVVLALIVALKYINFQGGPIIISQNPTGQPGQPCDANEDSKEKKVYPIFSVSFAMIILFLILTIILLILTIRAYVLLRKPNSHPNSIYRL